MTEEQKIHTVDRSRFHSGPWDGEPDKVLWKHDGFDCMIVRNTMGNLCGYVGVREGHPWFGVEYDNVNADVHGGLTYGDYCQGVICHPDPDKTYWLGFDCAHMGDLVPGMVRFHDSDYRRLEQYRDIEYVTSEVESLADQAKAAKPAPKRLMNFAP